MSSEVEPDQRIVDAGIDTAEQYANQGTIVVLDGIHLARAVDESVVSTIAVGIPLWHTLTLQSCGVWVFAFPVAFCIVHVDPVQVGTTQPSAVGAPQSLFTVHVGHIVETPSQTSEPPGAQSAPAAFSGCDSTPPLHTSSVQARPSEGFVASFAVFTHAPPVHTSSVQGLPSSHSLFCEQPPPVLALALTLVVVVLASVVVIDDVEALPPVPVGIPSRLSVQPPGAAITRPTSAIPAPKPRACDPRRYE